MPSARLKNRKQQRAKRGKGIQLDFALKINKKVFLYFSLAFCFAIFFYVTSVFTKTHYWNGTDKLAVAIRQEEGASILIFDPEYEELVRVSIPKHTEVDVAKQLGIWKVESLWELGMQEKMGGRLLADSITKHFKFPVAAWADEDALGFNRGGVKNLYRAGFGSYQTNLTLGDRARMAWFAFNVPNTRHVEIHLEDTGYVQKTTLSDGTEGYKKTAIVPQEVLAYFTDAKLGSSAYAVAIQDATGEGGVAKNVGSVVEVLGAKVAAVDVENEQKFDCLVKGKDEIVVARIAKLFSCETENTVSNFDLEIFLGTEFAKRF